MTSDGRVTPRTRGSGARSAHTESRGSAVHSRLTNNDSRQTARHYPRDTHPSLLLTHTPRRTRCAKALTCCRRRLLRRTLRIQGYEQGWAPPLGCAGSLEGGLSEVKWKTGVGELEERRGRNSKSGVGERRSSATQSPRTLPPTRPSSPPTSPSTLPPSPSLSPPPISPPPGDSSGALSPG